MNISFFWLENLGAKVFLHCGKLLVEFPTFFKGDQWTVLKYDDSLLDVSMPKSDYLDGFWRTVKLLLILCYINIIIL